MAHPALTDPEAAAKWLASGHRVYRRDVTGGQVRVNQVWQGSNFGKPLCRASVHNEYGVGFHQCTKPGVEQTADPERMWWCAIHGPTGAAKREVASQARWDAQRARDAAARRRAVLASPYVKALMEIAGGHNDPRSLAREVLGDLLSDHAA